MALDPATSIVELDPGSDPRWRRLTERPGTQLFASPRWARVLARTYHMDVSARLVCQDGEPRAGLPFARLRDPRGRRATTLPFSDFCDPIVTEGDEWNTLVEPLLAGDAVFQIRCLHSRQPRSDARFRQVGSARWHAVELVGDSEDQWGLIDGSARRAIRNARNHGLGTRLGTSREELRAFFDLHLRVRKNKYRLVAQPFRFFEAIWEEFFQDGSGRICYAIHDGEMVAGILLLHWQDTWYYKFNASDPAWLGQRPNDLILWTAIEHGNQAGMRRLDLGLSDADQDGLIRFKDKYAQTTAEITTLRFTPNGAQSPRMSDAWGRFLGTATRALTAPWTPTGVTELGGNLLYRYFA